MKKVLILIVLIAFPLLAVGQTTTSDNDKQLDTVKVEAIVNTITDINISETKTVLSTAAKVELQNLSYKKSNDLISIKAYKKSLQIKVKEIKNC